MATCAGAVSFEAVVGDTLDPHVQRLDVFERTQRTRTAGARSRLQWP